MCLTSRTNVPQEAKEPIKVYKVLTMNNLSPWELVCGRVFEWKHGMNFPEGESEILRIPGCFNIYGGWLHVYVSKEDAENLLEVISEHYFKKSKIVEMEIPAGASYFVSVEGDSICANMVEWKEETE